MKVFYNIFCALGLTLFCLPDLASAQARSAEKDWDGVRDFSYPSATNQEQTIQSEVSQTHLSEFLKMLKESADQEPLVVRGVVSNLKATRDQLPEEIWPEIGIEVVTDTTLEISDVLCGELDGAKFTVRYVGGKFQRGPSFHNSEMPTDPVIGEEYIFSIRTVGDINYLKNGRYSMLLVISDDVYSDGANLRISKEKLIEICN